MRKRYPGNYVFKTHFRQHRKGDPVPDSMDDGIVGTMLAGNRIEPAEGSVPPADKKIIKDPPADKSMSRRPGKVLAK